jgi:cytochrome c1
VQRLIRARTLAGALALGSALAAGAWPGACRAGGPQWLVAGGDARRAPRLIRDLGCASCHTVPGVEGAVGNVGPPLTRFAERTYIAGMLRNTPANLVRWIRAPQSVVPGNAMPDMGVSEAEARDIAAYLYGLH